MSSSTVSSSSSTTGTFGPLAIAVTLLSTATALVHLYLSVYTAMMVVNDPAQTAEMGGATALSVMAGLFCISFVGYVVLNVALYHRSLHRYHRMARWGLIVWAAGNVLAYAAMAVGNYDAFGLTDKAIEVLLIALLVIEGRRARA